MMSFATRGHLPHVQVRHPDVHQSIGFTRTEMLVLVHIAPETVPAKDAGVAAIAHLSHR